MTDDQITMQEMLRSLPKQDNLDKALELGREKLRNLHPEKQADITCVSFLGDSSAGLFSFKSLGRTIKLTYPEAKIIVEDGESMPAWEQILLLHYITGGAGLKIGDELVTFKQIPDGRFYEDAFNRRVKKPLIEAFAEDPKLLVRAGEKFGGIETDKGDGSVVISPFPYVTINYIVWMGDDELPPEGSILFRGDITTFFSAEDIAVATSMYLYQLIGLAKSL